MVKHELKSYEEDFQLGKACSLADLMCWVLWILIFDNFQTMIMISCWQHVFVVSSNHFVFNLCRMRLTLHFVAFDLSFDIDTMLFFCKSVQHLTGKRYKYWSKALCTPWLIFKTKIRELQKCNADVLSRELQWLNWTVQTSGGKWVLYFDRNLCQKVSVAFDLYLCNRIPLTYIWLFFEFLFIHGPLVFISTV